MSKVIKRTVTLARRIAHQKFQSNVFGISLWPKAHLQRGSFHCTTQCNTERHGKDSSKDLHFGNWTADAIARKVRCFLSLPNRQRNRLAKRPPTDFLRTLRSETAVLVSTQHFCFNKRGRVMTSLKFWDSIIHGEYMYQNHFTRMPRSEYTLLHFRSESHV
jgi:hypothetical protein